MLKDTMLNVIHAISDQGNALLSKSVVYVGVGGSSVGVASKLAENVSQSSFSDYGALAGIVGGVSLAIKSLADIYFAYKKNKREQETFEHDMEKGEE